MLILGELWDRDFSLGVLAILKEGVFILKDRVSVALVGIVVLEQGEGSFFTYLFNYFLILVVVAFYVSNYFRESHDMWLGWALIFCRSS